MQCREEKKYMQNFRSSSKIGNQTQLTNLNIQKTYPIQRQLIVGEDQDINLHNYLNKLNDNGIVVNEITQATIQQLINVNDTITFNSWCKIVFLHWVGIY